MRTAVQKATGISLNRTPRAVGSYRSIAAYNTHTYRYVYWCRLISGGKPWRDAICGAGSCGGGSPGRNTVTPVAVFSRSTPWCVSLLLLPQREIPPGSDVARSLVPQKKTLGRPRTRSQRLPTSSRGPAPVIPGLILSFLPYDDYGGTGKILSRVPWKKISAGGTL